MGRMRIKRETTLPKIRVKSGRLKETEPSERGSSKDVMDASQVCDLSDGQCGRDVENELKSSRLIATKTFVPVVDLDNRPLMPTTPSRARRWIKSKKATGFWKHGIYCVRLNQEPSDRRTQSICVGIDPGSKKEGYTVKSRAHTFINLNVDAITWVKENMESRRILRRHRRARFCPCRKPKSYLSRNRNFIAPSTKSRWQWKLRILNWLYKIYPITNVCVEDVKATSKKGCKKWNIFNTLETGKNWFYKEIEKLFYLDTKNGFQTYEIRNILDLKKSKNKKSNIFEAHCVDSWVLANSIIGGHSKPDNTNLLLIKPIRLHKRALHVQNPKKNNFRQIHGGTMSKGLKRGSLAIHKKHRLVYIGGTSADRISLHSVNDGKRICQNARLSDIKILTYNTFIVNPIKHKTY